MANKTKRLQRQHAYRAVNIVFYSIRTSLDLANIPGIPGECVFTISDYLGQSLEGFPSFLIQIRVQP